MNRNTLLGWLLVPALLLGGLSVLCLSPVQAGKGADTPDSAAFFLLGEVVDLHLEIGPKELDALRRDPRKYAKATLKEKTKDKETIYKDVGVHVKGAAGSFRGIDDKPGLTINMDKFVDGQRFHGMDKFHLANSVQDPSYLSELICGEMFRDAGVPASRVGHSIVTINGKRRGFYYLKEGYDRYFLAKHFGSRNGNFYDGGFLRDIDQPLQLVSGKDDVPKHGDLKALLDAARDGNVKSRYQTLEKLLDMDKFVSYLVLEVITCDWDGYPRNRNNYRIYHEPKTNKLTFIPSGMDQMFNEPNGSIFPDFQGFIARAFMETPEGRARYLNRMDEIMKKHYKTDERIKRLDDLQRIVQPALASVDAGAGRDFPNQVNRLREAIRQREKSVQQQLKQTLKK
jgi:spore coat protein H